MRLMSHIDGNYLGIFINVIDLINFFSHLS